MKEEGLRSKEEGLRIKEEAHGKKMRGKKTNCHCEERSDAAIS